MMGAKDAMMNLKNKNKNTVPALVEIQSISGDGHLTSHCSLVGEAQVTLRVRSPTPSEG